MSPAGLPQAVEHALRQPGALALGGKELSLPRTPRNQAVTAFRREA
jgi:hypothetical protein